MEMSKAERDRAWLTPENWGDVVVLRDDEIAGVISDLNALPGWDVSPSELIEGEFVRGDIARFAFDGIAEYWCDNQCLGSTVKMI